MIDPGVKTQIIAAAKAGFPAQREQKQKSSDRHAK
jgi:hypothetical protein